MSKAKTVLKTEECKDLFSTLHISVIYRVGNKNHPTIIGATFIVRGEQSLGPKLFNHESHFFKRPDVPCNFCDVPLACDNFEPFSAHKVILSALQQVS